jgi:hypothetical protein
MYDRAAKTTNKRVRFNIKGVRIYEAGLSDIYI